MALHKIAEICTEWFSICSNILQNFAPSSYLKALPNKITIQIKHVGSSTIFGSIKLNLSKCNGLWVVSTEQNMNFNFHPEATFVFSGFHKNGPI
jgi:hypothetical protein